MKRSAAVLLLFIVLSIVGTSDCIANIGIIPVTKFNTPAMPGGIPDGWKLERKAGRPLMTMEKDGNAFYLHLISRGDSSFGLRKEARVDVKKIPMLCWRWRVTKLPKGGDVRKSATDDQAVQVYVAFKESGFMGLNTPIIGYVWDNNAPKGWSGRSPQIGGGKLRYIVLRNKTDNVGQWYTERRNVYQDYKRLFADINGGEPQSATTGLQIYINSQRTKSPAESMIGDIYFSNEPADIALAESGKEAFTKKVARISSVKPKAIARISAVRPAVIAKKRSGKILAPLNCFSVIIEFDTNSTIIEDDYQGELQTVADYLMKYEDAKLDIVGHTDNVGSKESNMALSQQRAQGVANCLVEQFDIDPQRLNVRGAGSTDPIFDNDTPEGRRLNRNVLISHCPE
jgi:outer membrane protein OmpA-like peptidoglycan-associated protein